jgi:hypothetical protein
MPTPCLEVGWPLISSWLLTSRLQLLSRLLASENPLISGVLTASLQYDDGWVGRSVAEARAVAPGGLPRCPTAWKSLLRATSLASAAADMETLLNECAAHPQLRHYKPPIPLLEGRFGVNTALHGATVDIPNPREVARLLCGGQGLRGSDPASFSPASARTACLFCLTAGFRRKETLQHFVFECPLTFDVRTQPTVAECWAQGPAIFELHRDIWTWRRIRVIRRALSDMLLARAGWLSGAGLSTSSRVRHRLGDLWAAAS